MGFLLGRKDGLILDFLTHSECTSGFQVRVVLVMI